MSFQHISQYAAPAYSDEPLDLSINRADVAGSASAPSARDTFLARLADAEWWPTPQHQWRLLEFLCNALPECPWWPAHVGLAPLLDRGDGQCFTGQLAAAGLTGGSSPKLVLAYRPGHWQGPATPMGVWPSYQPAGARIELLGPPGDCFEALATGLTYFHARRSAPAATLPADARQFSGHQLRLALTDWLRTFAMITPDPLEWERRRSNAPHRPESAAGGEASRPPLPIGLRSSLAPLSAIPQRTLRQSVSRALPEPTPRVEPAAGGPSGRPAVTASMQEVQAMADALEGGAWSAEMYAVLPFIISRLEQADPFALFASPLRLQDAEGLRVYGFGQRQGAAPLLRRHIDGSFTSFGYHSANVLGPAAPVSGDDDFLRAYLFLSNVGSGGTVRTLRKHLAEVLRSQSWLARLCLTLHRQHPDAPDPDHLLRQCVEGRRLTLEGQQVMEGGGVARALDERAWAVLLAADFDVSQRRQWLFDNGYSLIRAYADLCAAFPRRRNEYLDPKLYLLGNLRRKMLIAEADRLLHVEQGGSRLLRHLGYCPSSTLRRVLGLGRFDTATAAAARRDRMAMLRSASPDRAGDDPPTSPALPSPPEPATR